jgi:hypothetical protein
VRQILVIYIRMLGKSGYILKNDMTFAFVKTDTPGARGKKWD